VHRMCGCGRSGTRRRPCRGEVARADRGCPRGDASDSVEALSGQDHDQARSSADKATGEKTAAAGVRVR